MVSTEHIPGLPIAVPAEGPAPPVTEVPAAGGSPAPPAAGDTTPPPSGRVEPVPPAADAPQAVSPLDRARSRVTTSTRRLLAAGKRLRPTRVTVIRREGRRLAADLRAYRAALLTHAPATPARRSLLVRLDRQAGTLVALDRALARYGRSARGRSLVVRTLREISALSPRIAGNERVP
jgi:hypothetical protein